MEKSVGLQMMELTNKLMNDIIDSELPATLIHYVIDDIAREINAQAKNNLVAEINELQQNKEKEDCANE
mgnify:FL=1|jgi:hypothetical protein|nr:MAG TPA: hypothetical protein [Caudoviricetes sp.]